MTHVDFINRRFDPDLTPFHELAKRMAEAFGHTARLTIDVALSELLRLRVAQLNPCSYCLVLHTKIAQDLGISAAKIAHLPSWRESAMYTDAEAAALAYAESLTIFDQATFARDHERLVEHFDAVAVAEIAGIVINMNVWTRLKMAQGAVPGAQDCDTHRPRSANTSQP